LAGFFVLFCLNSPLISLGKCPLNQLSYLIHTVYPHIPILTDVLILVILPMWALRLSVISCQRSA